MGLTQLRNRAGLRQRDLAECLGVTTKTISNWENGARELKLNPDQMQRLCQALHCSLSELACTDCDQNTVCRDR